MREVFYAAMSSRAELRVVLVAVAGLTALRCLPFLVPGVRFDADQAVIGLMAKHISEGRAFPLFFYGQSYLLAVEAYLAAPLMWLLGPTEAALKLPLVAMNVAAAVLVAWRGHRDLGLRPFVAGRCALPLALPPIVVGTRVMEAMGGNAELWLYAVLLWIVRERPWRLAVVAGVAVAHRELAVFGLVALLVLEAVRGSLWQAGAAARWSVVAAGLLTVRAAVDALRPFGAMFGPGTLAGVAPLDISSAAAIGAQLCLDPSRWSARFGQLVTEHLPLLVGAVPGPLNLVGVSTGIGHGHAGLGEWVLAMTAAGLVLGTVRERRGRAIPAAASAPPAADFGWYLGLAGLVSIAVYWLVACSQIGLESFRYDLMGFLLPVGALLVGARHASAATTAGLATAAAFWCVVGGTDYAALAGEIRSGRWPDYRGQVAAALEARGITAAWGDYRLAHVLTFRTGERVIVAATTRERIALYPERVRAAAPAPVVTYEPCPGGESFGGGIHLCPP